MNKVIIGGGLAIAVAGTAWAGGTWWSATRIEQGLRDYSTQLSVDPAMPVDMTVTSYERGPLTAHAVSRVALRGTPNLAVDLEHAIEHGPNPAFGWSRITTTVRWPEAMRPALAYYFEGNAPVTLVTIVGFDGRTRTEAVSPAFEKAPQDQSSGKVIWGGLTGSIDHPAADRSRSAFAAPRLALDTPAGSTRLSGLTVSADWLTSGPNSLYWTGSSSLGIAEVAITSMFGSYAVKNLAFSGYQKDQDKTLLAGYTVSAASGDMLSGENRQPLFRNAALEMELAGLDRQALTELLDGTSRMGRMNLASAEQTTKTVELIARTFEAIAAKSPSLALKRLGFETPQGMLSATGAVDLGPAAVGADPKDPNAWRERVRGSFAVEVSPGLARLALEKQVTPKAYAALARPGETVDPEAVKAMAAHYADKRLKQMADGGALRTKGDNYLVEIELKAGELMFNGLTREQFIAALAGQDGARGPAVAVAPMAGR
jgi:uncharacterized protein YdgA (DUF945 family)